MFHAIGFGLSKLRRDLFDRVRFNRVAGLKIIKAIHANAAFHAGAHFADLVLKSPQGLNRTLLKEALAPHNTRLATRDSPGSDHAAGHLAAFG